jgi:hypothetical protein
MSVFPFDSLVGAERELGLLVGVLIGFGFGFTLERAGFGRAQKLVGQFYGYDMTVFKVMFSGIVTAMLGLVVLSGLGLADFRAIAEKAASSTYLWPMLVGGLLLGAGFIISGYCPGTSWVATASGKLDGLATVLGVIVGQVAYAELLSVPAVARFQNSGDLGSLFLWDLLKLPSKAGPPVVAIAVTIMAVGCFIGAEKLEKVLAARADPAARATPAGRSGRFVFAGLAASALVGLALVALPTGTQAARQPRPIAPLDLARRVVDEPWKVRVLDLRDAKACAERRIPGSECVPPADLGKLGLSYVNPARALVLVGEGDLAVPPKEALAYGGELWVLQGGWKAWQAFALEPPQPPGPGAGPADLETFRLRAGLQSALTGIKAAPPPPAPTAAPAGPPKKGGGGCGS